MLKEEDISIWLFKISREDDQQAFRYLFDHYYPRLLNYALYFLKTRAAADQVVSDVFIGIWNNRVKLNKIEKFDSYIFRAVKNKSLNFIRDDHRITREELDINDRFLTKSVISPENSLINEELRATILKALDELPPRCRMVFELVKQDGFKYKEVAKLLDISVNTVENQIGKAMSLLRSKLKYLAPDGRVKRTSSQ